MPKQGRYLNMEEKCTTNCAVIFCSQFEKQYVPTQILLGHVLFLSLGLLLTIVTTAGYVTACESLRGSIR